MVPLSYRGDRLIFYRDASSALLQLVNQWLNFTYSVAGSSEVPRNPLTHWDGSSIPANGIFLTKKTKKQKCPQRVEND